MRWPLRNQILLRILLLLVVTLSASTWFLIRNGIGDSRDLERQKVEQITSMIDNFPFPKSNTVLEAMKSLSGAEFKVSSDAGVVLAQTEGAPDSKPDGKSYDSDVQLFTEEAGQSWYVRSIKDSFRQGSLDSTVSIFLPVESEADIFWRVGQTPLIVATVALPIALLFGWLFSNQITKPLARLCANAESLSQGEPINDGEEERNDEIGDLLSSMNSMATRIRDNEEQLKLSERYSALVDVGNGIAHHLRNSATGCRMALDLMSSKDELLKSSDEYQVATRQLDLMNSYIQRFLSLSRQQSHSGTRVLSTVDLRPVFHEAIELLAPMARHLDVELTVENCESCSAIIHRDDALQIILNLVTNAIRAAKDRALGDRVAEMAKVKVDLSVEGRFPTLTVIDNGAGPPKQIASNLFSPYVSGSADGVGLGLALVKGISDEIGGEVSWRRQDHLTKFIFRFPVA